ncbi:MAG: glutamate racemase [Bacillota bacterium]|nr:glutamate racemase [Bacillota bacterium]
MKHDANAPVAVLDSGLGGLTVLLELIRLMPEENYIYYGDAANAPYGEKSVEQVRALTLDRADFLLDALSAKALVVACNTATSAAIEQLRQKYPDQPVIGIEPALKPAALSGAHPRVLVLATPVTLRENKFQRLLKSYESKAEVLPLPCPGLVEMIEKGILEGPDLEALLKSLLREALSPPPDALVLGCTHYPLVEKSIRKVIGGPVKIFQGGPGTARETLRRLEACGLRRNGGKGSLELRSSDERGSWIPLVEKLFRSAMEQLSE